MNVTQIKTLLEIFITDVKKEDILNLVVWTSFFTEHDATSKDLGSRLGCICFFVCLLPHNSVA